MVSSDILLEVANSFDLKLLLPVNQVSTWYIDNPNNANSVINLIFSQVDLDKIDNYLILPESRSLLDHTFLMVSVSIDEKFI